VSSGEKRVLHALLLRPEKKRRNIKERIAKISAFTRETPCGYEGQAKRRERGSHVTQKLRANAMKKGVGDNALNVTKQAKSYERTRKAGRKQIRKNRS